MYCKANGFDMFPEEILIIGLLNVIQDKTMMRKVQEHLTETIEWE